VEIFERVLDEGGPRERRYVLQRCNGVLIGDRLSDNVAHADDYRFHDVFHYAYAAVLGWSPVTRALFRLRRKSDPAIDEAQDGARAVLIEEGASDLSNYASSMATEVEVAAGSLQLTNGRRMTAKS
jgi:hypothetical protein